MSGEGSAVVRAGGTRWVAHTALSAKQRHVLERVGGQARADLLLPWGAVVLAAERRGEGAVLWAQAPLAPVQALALWVWRAWEAEDAVDRA